MVLTIPKWEQVRDKESGSRYVLYHVHVEGYPLCRLRYRQFSCLHQQICRRRNVSEAAVASFPAKSLLPLAADDVELRRDALQQYLQLISQDGNLIHNHILSGFLLSAQLESFRLDTQFDVPSCVQLDVHFADESVVKLSVAPDLHTDAVLELLGHQLLLPVELTYHFGLFFVFFSPKGMHFLRRLCDFEAPYISLQRISTVVDSSVAAECSVVRLALLKSSWDTSHESQIYGSDVALNLLYVQRVKELEWRWVEADQRSRCQLSALQARGDKLRFIQRMSTFSDYGHVHFDECSISYGSSKCRVNVSLGFCRLVVKECGENETSKRIVHNFEMSDIRCWSLGRIKSDINSVDEESSSNDLSLVDSHLSFHYRAPGASMRWCTLQSPQAMFMAHCLNSLAEEMMRSRRGRAVLRPCDKLFCTDYNYLTVHGQLLARSLSSGISLAVAESRASKQESSCGGDAWRKQLFRFRNLVDRLSANADAQHSENHRCDQTGGDKFSEPQLVRKGVFDEIEDSDL